MRRTILPSVQRSRGKNPTCDLIHMPQALHGLHVYTIGVSIGDPIGLSIGIPIDQLIDIPIHSSYRISDGSSNKSPYEKPYHSYFETSNLSPIESPFHSSTEFSVI